jgi:hypothetical protein
MGQQFPAEFVNAAAPIGDDEEMSAIPVSWPDVLESGVDLPRPYHERTKDENFRYSWGAFCRPHLDDRFGLLRR